MIKHILVGIVANGGALYATTLLLKDVTYTGGWVFFLVVGIILGLLNTLVKPVLKIISLPFVLISAGLFLIVINAVILWLTAYILSVFSSFGLSLHIEGVTTYIFAAVIFGVINAVEHWLLRSDS